MSLLHETLCTVCRQSLARYESSQQVYILALLSRNLPAQSIYLHSVLVALIGERLSRRKLALMRHSGRGLHRSSIEALCDLHLYLPLILGRVCGIGVVVDWSTLSLDVTDPITRLANACAQALCRASSTYIRGTSFVRPADASVAVFSRTMSPSVRVKETAFYKWPAVAMQ